MIGAIRIVRGKLSEMGFSPNQATKVQKIFVPQATLQKKLENNRFFGVFMVYGLAKSQNLKNTPSLNLLPYAAILLTLFYLLELFRQADYQIK